MALSCERLSRDFSSYQTPTGDKPLEEAASRYVSILYASALDAPTVDSELIFVVTRPPSSSQDGKLDVWAQVTRPQNASQDVRPQSTSENSCSHAGHLEVDRLSLEIGLYAIYYTPKQGGLHTLNVLWNGEHLPMSPYTLVVQ